MLEAWKVSPDWNYVPPALAGSLAFVGSVSVTYGLWEIPGKSAWRFIVAMLGGVALIGLLMMTMRFVAWLLRDAFPMAGEGIFAAPIILAWLGVVGFRMWLVSNRGDMPDDGAQ